MARLPRFCPPGIAQHVIQRGNNRSVCFAAEKDFSAYANWLRQYADECQVAIHAWVFMTNHVHLLVTPSSEDGVSRMMQSVGRRYVRYFNDQYCRTGTLWEGRFKSSLVQSCTYLLRCYRYIELNPVRAGMVGEPSEYTWSSYRCNALGVDAKLCTAHEEYLKLGKDKDGRLGAYRALFKANVEETMVEQIRTSINSGLALGNDDFKERVERLYGRRVTPAKMGRPQKV